MSDNGKPWPSIRLGDLASEMCLGKMLDKQKNRGTFKPYLRNVNVRWFSFDLSDLKEMRFEEGEEARYGIQSGDLVICEGGEPGRAAVWKEQSTDARIQKALHRVRFRADQYDSSFAMYFLYYGTLTNDFATHYTGTTIKHLTGKALSQVRFPLPSVNEQRRIVAKIEELFSDLDAGVAALERAKANLKRYRAAVLKAAVDGMLTEQWRADNPDVEPATELLQRILAERRKRWEAEQLAKYEAKGTKPPTGWKEKYKEPAQSNADRMPVLPDAWCWATIEQINAGDRSIAYGVLQPGPDLPVGVPLVRVCDVANGRVALDQLKCIDPKISEQYRRTLLRGGEVLLTVVGTIGRTAIVPSDAAGANTARAVSVIPTSKFINAHFVEIVLRDPRMQARLTRAAHEVARKTLNLEDVRVAMIPLPPRNEQDEIVTEIQRLWSIADEAEHLLEGSLQRSARLRQSILKRAFEGKLVPQDPNDEPASKLLARIKAERAAIDANGGKVTKRSPWKRKSIGS